MHLRAFRIDGFGVLQRQRVEDLPRGLVLVLGDNESGKSTLKSFLTAMLCGAPGGDPGYEPHQGQAYGGWVEVVGEGEAAEPADSVDASDISDASLGPGSSPRAAAAESPRGSEEMSDASAQAVGRSFRRGASGRPSAQQTEPLDEGFRRGIYDRIYSLGLEEMQGLDILDGEGVRGRLLAMGAGFELDPSSQLESMRREASQWLRPRSQKAVVNRLQARRRELQRELREARREEGEIRQQQVRGQELESELKELEPQLEQASSALARGRAAEESVRWLDSVQSARAGKPARPGEVGEPSRASGVDRGIEAPAPRSLSLSWVAVAFLIAAFAALLLCAPLWLTPWLASRGLDWLLWWLTASGGALLAGLLLSLWKGGRPRRVSPPLGEAPPSGQEERPSRPQSRPPEDRETSRRRMEWEELAQSVPAWREEESRLRNALDRGRRELSSLRGRLEARAQGDRVGLLAQQLQGLEEEIDSGLRRWASWVLAEGMLTRAREELQSRRMPRAMERASACLGVLTEGKYRLLAAEEEVGKVEIFAVDSAGHRWDSARWSRGLGDQVYLALRLGLVLESDSRQQARPLLLDDVLVRFDPRRRLAAAELLLSLANRRQVFYFASHGDALELFRRGASDSSGMMSSEAAVAAEVPGTSESSTSGTGTSGTMARQELCVLRLERGRVKVLEGSVRASDESGLSVKGIVAYDDSSENG